jgi:hypothetical protein
MIATRLILAAVSAMALLAAIPAAHAEGWRDGGDRRDWRREREWREHAWREREWHERHFREYQAPYAYGYVAPPPVIFAPRW